MERTTHKYFGAMISCTGTILILTSGAYGTVDPKVVAVSTVLNTLIGYRTGIWPDADTHAYKPIPVILGLCKKGKVNGHNSLIYHRKAYKGTKGWDIKLVAIFFKLILVQHHRQWQSHTLAWLFVLFALFQHIYSKYGLLLSIPYLGFALGFGSHIFADIFTKEGENAFIGAKVIERLPLIGKILTMKINPLANVKIFGKNPFKATNKAWNIIFLIISFYICSLLLLPKQTSDFTTFLFNLIKAIIGFISKSIVGLLSK